MAKREDTTNTAGARIEEFAEDLGKLLGHAQSKAEGWLNQRQAIAEQLAGVRDTANRLLEQLTGGGAKMAAAVRRGRGGRPAGTKGKGTKPRRKMSAAGRARIAAAQKKRWAAIRAAEAKKKQQA